MTLRVQNADWYRINVYNYKSTLKTQAMSWTANIKRTEEIRHVPRILIRKPQGVTI
jgi:hypothetical protein